MSKSLISSIRNSKRFILILGIIIITVTYAVIMISLHCAPFGEGLLINGDNVPQILPYVQELKTKLTNGESIYYTWNINGGANYYYLFVYVLVSPMSLFLTLFPIRYFSVGLNIGLYIHSVLMYVTMYHYLTHRLSGRRVEANKCILLPLGISYALLPALLNAGSFYPFMGGFVVLPMVILGLERFCNGKGWKLYYICIILLFICNFYIAILECIFIFLYFFTLEFDSFKSMVVKGIRILLLSICSIMSTSFIIIPAVVITLGGGWGVTKAPGGGFMTNWLNVLSQILMFRSPVLTGDNGVLWPANLYCGTLIVILALAYFSISSIKLACRLKRLCLLVLFMLSLNVPIINYVFHAFHEPFGLPNRHSIIILFYVIIMAGDTLDYYASKAKKKSVLGIAVGGSVVLVVDVITMIFTTNSIKSAVPYIVTLVLVAVYFVLFIYVRKRKVLIIAICVISVLEVCYNYRAMFFGTMTSYDMLYSIYEDTAELMGEIHADKDFYRASFNESGYVFEPGMAFGNKSICGYSTVFNGKFIDEMIRLGVTGGKGALNEDGYTPFVNSIISRRYIVEASSTLKNQEECHTDSYDSIYEQYKLIDQVNGYNLYRNNMTVNPVMISSNDKEVLQRKRVEGKNPVANNNALCNMLTGVDNIMEETDMNVAVYSCDNCVATCEDSKVYVSDNTLGYGGFEYDATSDSNVTLVVTAKKDGDYYIKYQDFTHIGYLKKGQSKKIKYDLDSKMFERSGMASLNISTMTFDNDKFEEVYNILKSNELNITSYTDNSITGTLKSNGDHLVFTTIPYDKGWSIYVDGKQVKTESINEAFLTFHVPDGEHDIYMEYHVRGLIPGIILSVVFAAIGIFMIIRDKKKSA